MQDEIWVNKMHFFLFLNMRMKGAKQINIFGIFNKSV